MAAILGKLDNSIESLCELATRSAGQVVPANYNTLEQIVVSGEVSGVERVMELAKLNGAKRAVRLLTSPVRWAGEVAAMAAQYPDALFVEMGPGSVLTGLLTRIVPAAAGMACGTPAEIEKLLNRVAA